MKNSWRWRLVAGGSVGLVLLFWAQVGRVLSQGQQQPPDVLAGGEVPEFVVRRLNPESGSDPDWLHSEVIGREDLRGRPAVLNFWASWCLSCRAEAVELEAFWQEVRGRGALVIGVAVQDSAEAVYRFARQSGKTYPLGVDESAVLPIHFGITGVPETIFVDSTGKVVQRIRGPVGRLELRAGLARAESAGGAREAE